MTRPKFTEPDFPVIEGLSPLPVALQRPVVAIGNFDGVHRGHQAVARAACEMGARMGRPALALTFEPHPRSVFQPSQVLFRLTPAEQKAICLARAGLDGVIILPFDAALAAHSADAFVDDILVRGLDVSGAVVGFDFHFGRGRGGSPDFLRQAGAARGFEVEVVDPMLDEGDPISSSAIRAALAAGQVGHAAHMLGRPWSVRAQVIHGEKRGRTLGYPTANLALAPGVLLAFGIYAVRVWMGGAVRDGVASYGRRPTFDDGAPLLEVHLFDYRGDLYGQTLDVAFHGYIRPEMKFEHLDALVARMDQDSIAAKAILARQDSERSGF